MTVTHPVALRDGRTHPGAYTYGSTSYSIDADGVIDCPDTLEAEIADALAGHYDVDADDLLDTDGNSTGEATCDVVKSDGETCGRELPCQYHSED